MRLIEEQIEPPNVAPPSPSPVAQTPATRGAARVFFFFSLAIGLTGLGALLFADLLWRIGWTTAHVFLLGLFTTLLFLASVGCTHGIYGFCIRRFGSTGHSRSFGDYRDREITDTSTALIFPIYNEDARRVLEGVRVMHESLARTGHLDRFDFFILSDSTDPDKWVEEERRWFQVARELGALGRMHYRRRMDNEGKKSGNVRDFLRTWGKRYRYFIVLDADSIMSGATIVDLVKIMEANPRAGLVQTVPALVNAQSAFGRIQQFANWLYGPLFSAGLHYWSQNGGNYWGHNAIIRVEPFMELCDLPQLPGDKPFGGHILSHDFVEAALLRRENWEVWLAPDLAGSYEEAPPTIIENAQRDRRWCQGNLQHFLLLFARGLRGISRIHLGFGILAYLAGPLWFAFIAISTWLLWYRGNSGLSEVVVGAFTPINLDRTGHALLVFGFVMAVIFLPKILSLIDLAFDRRRRQAFGGMFRASVGAVAETIFSTLHAPLQMLFHTKFVIAALFGANVHWTAQSRVVDGTSWAAAARQHAVHTAIGISWGALTWSLDAATFWWFAPVLAGMVFSIPLSVFSSRQRLGKALRKLGLFVTPQECAPDTELMDLEKRMATRDPLPMDREANDLGLLKAVLDPYVNAIHVTLLREKNHHPDERAALTALGVGSEKIRSLGERLLSHGIEDLTRQEHVAVLSDPDVMLWAHREVWRRPRRLLAPCWHREDGTE